MQEYFQPVLDAARDEAIKNMPMVMAALAGGLVTIIGLTVGLTKTLVKRGFDEAKLKLAATMGVQLVEARTQDAVPMPEDPEERAKLKKEMADGIAEVMLAGSSKKLIAKIGSAVQTAWQADDESQKMRASAPTKPETPSAKADLGS